MSRPKKCRRVCEYPPTLVFMPQLSDCNGQEVILTIDEYETIRLIDKEGLSQEQCGERMQVARTTVQLIYANARKKLADALVEGRPLRIEGGDYQLCCGDHACGESGCYKQLFRMQHARSKGDHTMRIAVTYQNGEVFQHFGHTEQFKIYDVENGEIMSSEVVDTNGHGHGALAGILSAMHVDALICGGIGGGAQAALAASGIRLYGGVSGSADKAALALVKETLVFNPDVRCDHHEHHDQVHPCGDHGCGNHDCGQH